MHAAEIAVAAERSARAASPWIERAARLGYCARGGLYLTIGVLAFRQAFGESTEDLDTKGALREIHAGAFGTALLVAMIVGLAGHSLWRLVQGTLDPEGEVRRAGSPLLRRVALLGRCALHVALVVFAVRLLVGDDTEGETARSIVGEVMRLGAAGVVAVALAGIAVVAVGVNELRHVACDDFAEKLDGRVRGAFRRLAANLGRLGTTARGLVFMLVGGYLVFAAIEDDPAKARGVGSALASLHNWTFGWTLVAATGFGLTCYGLFQLVQARWRRITPC